MNDREPLREFRSPTNNGVGTSYYDMIIEENDHLLINSKENRDFKKLSSKFWNVKERITFI
jgi:hypothetical protein